MLRQAHQLRQPQLFMLHQGDAAEQLRVSASVRVARSAAENGGSRGAGLLGLHGPMMAIAELPMYFTLIVDVQILPRDYERSRSA